MSAVNSAALKTDAVKGGLYDYVLLSMDAPADFMSFPGWYIQFVAEAAQFQAVLGVRWSPVVARSQYVFVLHRYCPDMQALHKDFYIDDLLDLPARLLLGEHPLLAKSGARVGMSARTVVASGLTPVVELGIVDKAGLDGGLGAGLYRPPVEPFAAALAALAWVLVVGTIGAGIAVAHTTLRKRGQQNDGQISSESALSDELSS